MIDPKQEEDRTRRPGEPPSLSPLASAMRKAGPYLNIGWMFAASLILGLVVGRWLDRRLGIEPWGTLAGLLLGIVLGFVAFFRVVLRLDGKGSGGSR